MKTFLFDSFLNLMANLRGDNMPELTNNVKDIDVVFRGLSLSGYAIPLEGAFMVSLILLGVYIILENNFRLHSQEKFRLAISIIHRAYTPLLLLRNGLEDIMESGVAEEASQMLKPVLKQAEHILGFNQNVISLGKAEWKEVSKTDTVEVELHEYVQTVTEQCRPYADSHHIRMEVSYSAGHASCRINETFMTAALQCLLDKLIEITNPDGCIYVNTSYDVRSWKLQISNCKKIEKKTIMTILPESGYSDLRTVRKIIRLHGGRMKVYRYGKSVAFQIAVPADCHCHSKAASGVEMFFHKRTGCSDGNNQECQGGECATATESSPRLLLIMADSMFGNYLQTALSGEFNTSLHQTLDMPMLLSNKEKPDAIIIDENVNGICGDELCSQIKAEEATAGIPVILLVEDGDSKSYLSHTGCGADRLELRTVNMCRLRADIRMLIDSRVLIRKRITRVLADTVHMVPETVDRDESNLLFISKVRKLLEENLSREGYTIDMLCTSLGMSRTIFYIKMKELTGKPPVEYMLDYKMERAKMLLTSGRYNITEIAGMLGYCDAKYFGKKFKSFYHICPTGYLKEKAEQAMQKLE